MCTPTWRLQWVHGMWCLRKDDTILCQHYLCPPLKVMLKSEGCTLVERGVIKKDIPMTRKVEQTFSPSLSEDPFWCSLAGVPATFTGLHECMTAELYLQCPLEWFLFILNAVFAFQEKLGNRSLNLFKWQFSMDSWRCLLCPRLR